MSHKNSNKLKSDAERVRKSLGRTRVIATVNMQHVHPVCVGVCVCVFARFACGRIFLSNQVCALSVHIDDPADVAYRAQHRRQSCQNHSHAA